GFNGEVLQFPLHLWYSLTALQKKLARQPLNLQHNFGVRLVRRCGSAEVQWLSPSRLRRRWIQRSPCTFRV
ncbi:hypothetical protein L218DRAFT_1028161, partial [Marasmius fiardii PR-910]